MLRESLDRGRINRGRSGRGAGTRPWQGVEIDLGRRNAGKAEKASEGGASDQVSWLRMDVRFLLVQDHRPGPEGSGSSCNRDLHQPAPDDALVFAYREEHAADRGIAGEDAASGG